MLRVQTVESLPCWYGYIYTQNSSPYALSETLRPEFEGLSVMYPPMENGSATSLDIELLIPANEDHIVILRRTQANCSYSLGYLTHERTLTDAQMVQMAIEMDDREKTYFGQSAAFYKLCRCEQQGFVIYLQNDDHNQTLHSEFKL